jgi:hypothetical protein
MTTKTLSKESDEILQELVEAGIPVDASKNDQNRTDEVLQPGAQIIHRGNDDFPAPVTAKLSEAGWIEVYFAVKSSPRYGESSLINLNMLPAQLKKRDPDTGQRAFTVRDPGVRPKQGSEKCWLHSDHEMRPVCDSFGFQKCSKDNLTSPYEAREHVSRKHSREYAALEDRRDRLDRSEERAIQRGLAERLGAVIPQEEAIATQVPPAAATLTIDAPFTTSMVTGKCKKCGESFEAKNEASLSGKLGGHSKKIHPKLRRK